MKELNPENWALIADTYFLTPIYGGNGRVFVKQDPFSSRLDCTVCKGTGITGKICPECKGNGKFRGKQNTDDRCTTCYIESNIASVPGINLKGKEPCPTCKGTGSSSIIIPDESKKQTTMGQVLAVSESDIHQVKVNDKVMFTNYTGNEFEFCGEKFRICVEKDLLCIVKKKKESSGGIIEQQSYADLENVGIPGHE